MAASSQLAHGQDPCRRAAGRDPRCGSREPDIEALWSRIQARQMRSAASAASSLRLISTFVVQTSDTRQRPKIGERGFSSRARARLRRAAATWPRLVWIRAAVSHRRQSLSLR